MPAQMVNTTKPGARMYVRITEAYPLNNGVHMLTMSFPDGKPPAELFTHTPKRFFAPVMNRDLGYDDFALYLGPVKIASVGEAKTVQFVPAAITSAFEVCG